MTKEISDVEASRRLQISNEKLNKENLQLHRETADLRLTVL